MYCRDIAKGIYELAGPVEKMELDKWHERSGEIFKLTKLAYVVYIVMPYF